MTNYIYYGNKDEQIDGTSGLIVESGEVLVGHSGDFTDQEFGDLTGRYIFMPGATDPDHPVRRLNFPWAREDVTAAVGIGGPPVNVTPPDITPAAPSNTVAPTLSGSAQQGATLTTSNGSWANTPTSYTYYWETSPNGTSGWVTLGHTANTYIVQAGDVGNYLRCQVTAINATGSTTANSNADGPIVSSGGGVPVNSVAPAVTGGTVQGSVLTTTNGTWSNSPTGYTYYWEYSLDGSTGWTTLGATTNTYTLVSGDVGHYIRCQVTAANGSGSSAVANSNSIGPVTAPSAGTPVSFVQSVVPTISGTSPVFIGALPSPTVNGNTVVVGLQLYGGNNTVMPHVVSVSDGGTNTFQVATASDKTLLGTPDYGLHTVYYYCENITGKSSHSITVTLDTSSVYVFMTLWELSPSVLDQANGNTGTNSTAADVSGGTLTPSVNGTAEMFLGNTDGDPNSSFWDTTGWTVDYNSTGGGGATVTAHRTQSTAASLDLGMSYANTSSMMWCASGIVFKPAVVTGVPVNSSAPTLSGAAQVGHVLTASHGSWSQVPTSYAYQWQTSANGTSGWTNKSGATSSTYTPVSGDLGNYLRCVVTASNSFGAGTAFNSAATAQITVTPVTLVQAKTSGWGGQEGGSGSGLHGLSQLSSPNFATTDGNTLVLAWEQGVGGVITSVVDNAAGGSNVWTIVSGATIAASDGSGQLQIAYCIGAKSISQFDYYVTVTTGNPYSAPQFYELTPCSFVGASTGTNTASGASSGSPVTIGSSSITPTENGAFAVAQALQSGGTLVVGSGWTEDFNASGWFAEHMAQATAAAITGTAEVTSNGLWIANLAVFQP